MAITGEDLESISKEVLRLLKTESVDELSDLVRITGRKFNSRLKAEDKISFSNRPSNLNTKAYTVSYIRPNEGILLEFKINYSLDYSLIILKSDRIVQSYSPLYLDINGNIIQNKTIRPANIALVKEELQKISMKLA